MAKCKLCGSDKKLLKSHIIPEFMYKTMYDESHKFHCISSITEKPNYVKRKGEWERLLCNECEVDMSKYEGYVALLLNGKMEINVRNHNGLIEISGIDYKLFKLFQLSILWKASISNRALFNEVALGKHEEVIRKMLLSGKPAENNKYGCIMIATMHDGEHIDSMILQPKKKRVDGQICYRFVFGGFWWLFFCASHKPNAKLTKLFINAEGTGFLLTKELSSAEHVVQFAAEVNV